MTTIDTTLSVHAERRPHRSLLALAQSASDGFSTLVNRLLDWQERARQRRQLLACQTARSRISAPAARMRMAKAASRDGSLG